MGAPLYCPTCKASYYVTGGGVPSNCSECGSEEIGVDTRRWRDPIFLPPDGQIVQVLCRVLPDKPHDGMPREVNLGISTGDVPVGHLFVSIGFPDENGDSEAGWFVAGWNMAQDCWQDARRFEVLGWQPTAAIAEPHESR